tara:strand:+ start:4409 stop:5203 length:795 start_codon:yes stop_codon:yes gene_type:complete
MVNISVILPTYNERDNILEMIESTNEVLKDESVEIIVVDDNSPDQTSEVVKKATKRFSNLRLLTRTEDKGLVSSLRDGIRISKGKICVWLDADLSMNPVLIKKLLKEIEQGADIAIGSRYIEGGGIKGSNYDGSNTTLHEVWKNLYSSEDSFYCVMISQLGNWAIRHILNPTYKDYTSGFYAVKRETLNEIELQGKYLEYCISLTYLAILKGYKVVEVPITLISRKHGKSKTALSTFSILSIAYDCFKTAFLLRFNAKKGTFLK